MERSIRLLPEPLRSRAFGSIGATYMGVGSSLDKKDRIVFIQNLTNGKVMVSFDGINDYSPLPVYGFLLLDVCQNKTESDFFSLSIGDRIYVKEIDALSTGFVYVTVFYGKDD